MKAIISGRGRTSGHKGVEYPSFCRNGRARPREAGKLAKERPSAQCARTLMRAEYCTHAAHHSGQLACYNVRHSTVRAERPFPAYHLEQLPAAPAAAAVLSRRRLCKKGIASQLSDRQPASPLQLPCCS